jgi:hypothetical protein
MQTVLVLCLGALCVVLFMLLLKISSAHRRLLRETETLRTQLEEATSKLAEFQAKENTGGLFQNAVSALVGLGVPGLVLLAVMATTGFAGAAAITTALAALGGPFGMLGGIAALIALGLASKALAEYGFRKLAQAVVRGLIAKGESKESIFLTLNSIPRWILPNEARSKAIASLAAIR